MGSNQMLLVTASIFLLTILILNFYSSNTNQMSISVNNEAIITATGIAQSFLDNIQTRAFDETTVSSAVSSESSLTAAASLGPDAGEGSPTTFDDIDDFNNYSTVDSSTRLGNYSILIDVYYVTTADPSTATNTKTFLKRIDVKIAGDYLPDTLELNHLIAY